MKRTLLLISFTIAVAILAFSAVASNGTMQKSLFYEDIKITLDGREIKPCDVNGNYIEPFIIEGTTYLPVRGIASSLGLDVGWDGETSTVILDDKAPDVKAMLYDENGIRVAYNGYSEDVEDPRLLLFVYNDTDKDISIKVYDISQNNKKDIRKYNHVIFAGKRTEVTVPLEKNRDVKFSFAVLDEKTRKTICEDIKVTVTDGNAELEPEEIPTFEFEGEATRETFAEFLKSSHQYILNHDIYGINISFSDVDIFRVGTVKMKYSVVMNEFIFEAFTMADVYDHINNKMVTIPVSMEARFIEKKKERTYDLNMVFDYKIAIKSTKIINTEDNSVKKDETKYVSVRDKHNVSSNYHTIAAQDGRDVLAKDVNQAILDLIISEGNKLLAEKAPGLSLDLFELDKMEVKK